MPTPILQLPLVSPNQNQKETTINSALAILEAASNDARVITVTGNANVVVSQDNFTRWLMQRVQGNTAEMTVQVPALKRFFVVAAEGTAAVTFYPTGGVATTNGAKVPAGTISLLMSDGVNIRALSSGVTRLTDLTDVVTTPAANGQVLSYILAENRWRPATIAEVLNVAFTSLTDAPSSYAGHANKLVRVKNDMTGIEFVDPTAAGANEFTDLDDTPSNYVGHNGKLVAVNADGTGLEFVAPPVRAFTDLGDAPASYDGHANKAIFVNTAGNGLVFKTIEEAAGSGIAIEKDGVQVKANVSRVNFTGDAVEISDPGDAGEITIEVTAPEAPGPYGKHAYWRVVFLSSAGTTVQLRELQLRGAPGGPDLVQGNLAAATASQATSPAANAFDGVATTFWEGLGPQNAQDCWLRAQLTQPISVVEIAMTITTAATAPIRFKVQYSDDGAAWTDAWSPKAQTGWSADEQRAFNYVAAPTYFTELGDAPPSYAGAAGKSVKVNAQGNGLEFGDATGGGSALAVQKDGAVVSATPDFLNFAGDGVTVTSSSSGVLITITGSDEPTNDPHAYWRILCVSTSSSYWSTKEVQFRASLGGPNLATGGTPSASSSYNTNTPNLAFDNNLATEWGSAAGDLADDGAWLAYAFTAPVAINEVSVAAADSLGESLVNAKVQYSDDGVTWETAWNIPPQSPWSNNEVRAFAAPSAEATFIGLTDTPANYSGAGGKLVAVSDTADSLVFVEDQSASVIAAKTGSYVAAAADAYSIIPFDSGANLILTLPANGDVALGVNTQISVLAMGTGKVEIQAASGVTLRYPADLYPRTRSQWSSVMALKIATNTWVLLGDMEPVT